MFIREVVVRYKKSEVSVPTKRFSNSRDLWQHFRADMNSFPVEVFRVLFLNSKNQMMCFEDVSKGSLSTSVVHPRDTLWFAVYYRAAAIICMHNHPSGDCAPSREDREATERLVKACQILGIRCLDHIVFGFDDYFSFADSGLLGNLCQTEK